MKEEKGCLQKEKNLITNSRNGGGDDDNGNKPASLL
jgi:hypothetical protein